jgi:predicted Zn-dependent peptidase
MIINKPSPTDLSGFYIVYKGSVLNEDISNYGISHLMEHLMCKQFQKLYNDFDRYSINWNAYTSGNEVVFHMKGLDEYLYKYRHELLNSLLSFNVPKKEFENELNVVIQEYKDTFQDQFTSAYYNLLRKIYKNYGPIGKLQTLQTITWDDANAYWEKYLSKPTMIINISKNSEFDGFGDFNTNLPNIYTPNKDDELIYEKVIDFNKSCIAGYIEVDKDMAYIDFVLEMLGKSLESPFMKEIREKRGLTYGVHNYVADISSNQGLVTTSLITTDDKVKGVLDVYKMILSDPDNYLTEDRFNLIKDYYTVKKKMDEINAYSHHKKFIKPEQWLIENILDDITFEKTKEIFDKYLTFDNWKWMVDKTEF